MSSEVASFPLQTANGTARVTMGDQPPVPANALRVEEANGARSFVVPGPRKTVGVIQVDSVEALNAAVLVHRIRSLAATVDAIELHVPGVPTGPVSTGANAALGLRLPTSIVLTPKSDRDRQVFAMCVANAAETPMRIETAKVEVRR